MNARNSLIDIALLTGILLIGVAYSQNKHPVKKSIPDPFKNLNYTKVVIYNFNLADSLGRSDEEASIIKKGKLHKSTIFPGKELDSIQVKKVFSIINDKKTYDGPWAACFVPRHGIVFYDAADSVVAYINICFECNYLESSIAIPASGKWWNAAKGEDWYYRDYKRIKNVEEAFDKRTIQSHGFSKMGRRKLIDFCNELNMPYCGEVESSLFHPEK